MSELIEIRIPDIGDFSNVPVVEIPVTVGDIVAEGDAIVVLESDKATLDVPSSHAGRIAELKIAKGDHVSQGSLVLVLEAADGAAAAPVAGAEAVVPPAEPERRVEPVETPHPVAVSVPDAPATGAGATAAGDKPVYASPAIRRYARQLGVAIGAVKGSGPHDRITRQDVEAYVKQRLTTAPGGGAPLAGLPEWPSIDYAQFGAVERAPLSRIARISGPALTRNAMVIPHVTNFDKADVTELEAFRKTINGEAGAQDAKITMLAFAVKAAVAALKAYPKFNASLDGEELILKRYYNIGFAADTPEGLVAPVVKDADNKGVRAIAAELAELAAQARAGKLKQSDMRGGTFTISSLGGIGGTNFTPIINAPEVAILGMTRAEIQPVWDGTAFQPRLVQPVSLSWDHRVVDGVAAARFLVHVCQSLSDLRRIAL